MKETIKRFTTPKQTKDWYIKWAASILILMAMILRATGDYPFILISGIVNTLVGKL